MDRAAMRAMKSEEAELARRRYPYRRLIVTGKAELPLSVAAGRIRVRCSAVALLAAPRSNERSLEAWWLSSEFAWVRSSAACAS
jgi:hypothetical protein